MRTRLFTLILVFTILTTGCSAVSPAAPVSPTSLPAVPPTVEPIHTPVAQESPSPQLPAAAQAPAETGQPPVDSPRPRPLGVQPPAAVLHANGLEQTAGIGTYCWQDPNLAGKGFGLCADMIGIPTAQDPLRVQSPVALQFDLLQETPTELVLTVAPVKPEDSKGELAGGQRWWSFPPGENAPLALETQPKTELTLDPGLYVLDLFARWEKHGDVAYGFLIEVTQP